jgi:hypothetical protein
MTMAAKKSTPGSRSRRNPSESPAASAFNFEALHDHIEEERGRLMNAEGVLDCVLVALEEDERMDAPGPYYPGVIRIARDIVHTSIAQLDSIHIKAALTRPQAESSVSPETSTSAAHAVRKYDGVKESPSSYVH